MKQVKRLRTIHKQIYQPVLNKMEREARREDAKERMESFWPKWVKWFFARKRTPHPDIDHSPTTVLADELKGPTL